MLGKLGIGELGWGAGGAGLAKLRGGWELGARSWGVGLEAGGGEL